MEIHPTVPLLGGFSDEILLKILDLLSANDRFNMSSTNSKFNALVHNCTKWKLELHEDCSRKLKRFSSDVKVIKNFIMFYEFDVYYEKGDVDDLNEDDFYSFFKNHPEIVTLGLPWINSETLSYIGHFCRGLKTIDTLLYTSSRNDFRLGFDNLETLDLNIDDASDVKHICSLLKHVSALPALRVFLLCEENYPRISDDDNPENLENLTEMVKLESLSTNNVSEVFVSKIIKACGKSLTSLIVNDILDDDIYVLTERCPNLIKFQSCSSTTSRAGYSALFRQFGRNLETLWITQDDDDCFLMERDLRELINSKPNKLKNLCLNHMCCKNQISSAGYVKFIKKHGQQLDHLYLGESDGLDDSVLSAIVENCPQVVQNGIWNLCKWKIDILGFVADYGASVQVLSVPETLTTKDLYEIAVCCPKLHALDIRGCCLFTRKGLKKFLAACKGLRTLGMTEAGLDKYDFIGGTYPNLKVSTSEDFWDDYR